ncbi:MAG: hypothetical protein GX857_13780 [Bacteroidales bacterium]|nr:hypothetical protein [Bacteroidales bacterium]
MMKKQNIIKSLLSLILSVSMLVTGLGLTVHASVNGDQGEQMEAGGQQLFGGGPVLHAVIEENLVTNFELTIIRKDYSTQNIENGLNYEFDVEDLNALEMTYRLTKPDELTIESGYTYKIKLPDIFSGNTTNPIPIIV